MTATHRDFAALAKDANHLSMQLYRGYEPLPLAYRRLAFSLMMDAGGISNCANYGSKCVERWNVIVAQAHPKPRDIIMLRAQLSMVERTQIHPKRRELNHEENPLLTSVEAVQSLHERLATLTSPYRTLIGDIPLTDTLPPLSSITIRLNETDRARVSAPHRFAEAVADLAQMTFGIHDLQVKLLHPNGAPDREIRRFAPTS